MHLRLPVDFQPFHVDVPEGYNTREILLPGTMVNRDLQEWLAKQGLVVPRLRYFHSTPISMYLIHVDICDPWPNDFAFLNYAYGGEGSQMAWYDVDGDPYDSSNNVSKRILSWDPDRCREICRTEIGKPTLINTGKPHTLIPGTTARKCYSLALFEISGRRATWDHARSRLAQWQA